MLTAADAARLAQVRVDTIYRLIGRGDLEAVHVGRLLRIEPRRLRRLPEAGQRMKFAPLLYCAGINAAGCPYRSLISEERGLCHPCRRDTRTTRSPTPPGPSR